MLACAKLAGEACERYLKQPAVLAEILAGVALGISGPRLANGNDISPTNMVGSLAKWVAIAGIVSPFLFG